MVLCCTVICHVTPYAWCISSQQEDVHTQLHQWRVGSAHIADAAAALDSFGTLVLAVLLFKPPCLLCTLYLYQLCAQRCHTAVTAQVTKQIESSSQLFDQSLLQPSEWLPYASNKMYHVWHCNAQCLVAKAGASVDSWDRLREESVSCLMKLPCPLPGLDRPEALVPELSRACHLLRSPRVRESDAGWCSAAEHQSVCA